MNTTGKTASTRRADRRQAGAPSAALAELLLTLTAAFDNYRPERHYMRGPGPKWHAKHDPAPGGDAVPALAQAR